MAFLLSTVGDEPARRLGDEEETNTQYDRTNALEKERDAPSIIALRVGVVRHPKGAPGRND